MIFSVALKIFTHCVFESTGSLPPPLSAHCILLDMTSEGFPLSGHSQSDLHLSPQLEAPNKQVRHKIISLSIPFYKA